MPVIHLPARRARHARSLEPIHRTTARVGVFAAARRARSTGPQAHLSPYMADEERAVRKQVLDALGRAALVGIALYCGFGVGRAAWHLMQGWAGL